MSSPVSRSMLLVEDEDGVRFSVGRFFKSKGYVVTEADTCASGERAYRASRPDAVVLDYHLPDGDGGQLLRTFKAVDPSVPIVILTGHGTIDLAVKSIKEGADQFFTKPVELPALEVVIERLVESSHSRQIRRAGLDRDVQRSADPFLGQSPAIQRLSEQARRVVHSASPILVQGETGTGKGLLAKWLHMNGPRAHESFVDLNCAGLSREFLETELFGHEKGAFTGAIASKQGLLEMAHRGTLFLDEIGDVDPTVQPKLLKVLEERRFRRLGSVRDLQVDTALIGATHQNLQRLATDGRFRSDLYYRISAIPLVVPPLRERGRDVILLARVLLERIAVDLGRRGPGLAEEAEKALLRHTWPGNIRELRNTLERAVLLGSAVEITGDDIRAGTGPEPLAPRPKLRTLRDVEREHIEAVLAELGGDVRQASGVLGLSRSALYQKIRNHGISLSRC